MAIVRWEPTREVDSMQSEVNRVFDAFFGNGAGAASARRWVPAMDLAETDEQLVLKADLPGLSGDDVEIEVNDRVLTVSGERKVEREESSEGLYRSERAYGSFARSLTLPEGVDAESITAEFEDGVLEVRIPKPEERKPHRVAIGAASLNGSAAESTER